jgi:hypothetical protein
MAGGTGFGEAGYRLRRRAAASACGCREAGCHGRGASSGCFYFSQVSTTVCNSRT